MNIVKEDIDHMDKKPLKKVKMMDIIRKKPGIVSPAWSRKEEQVKFSISKKAEEVERKGDAYRKEVAVETTPLRTVAQKEKEEEIKKAFAHEEIKPVEPRILEMHTEHERKVAEPRPESLPPSVHQYSQEVKEANERLRTSAEGLSLESDRPIAYIPKEAPSREEKRVLERIDRREHEKVRGKKGIVSWIIGTLLLGMIAYGAVAVLPRAEIVLVPKKMDWAYTGTIAASTKVAEIDPANKQIPVAVFSEKKTNAFQFPATGSGKSIERKATGKVIVYNEFSASAQPLLAGTRLETPDGKIFRLKDRIIVPGAKTTAGELVPASIEADVVADKAGEAYNISPVSKFTIPGFKGTTKYNGFYAESKESMTGGFIGEGKYPTTYDIKAAKESAEKQMKGVIESFLATQVVPEGFKTIESSRTFNITKEVVNEAVDDQGNFSVYIEAEGGVDALKEAQVLELMTALAQQANGPDWRIREKTLSYGDMAIDSKTGEISLGIDFKGNFWKPIDLDDFKRKVSGKKEDELKAFIFSSTSIEKADVALWPFWVRTVPNDPGRVKVELK